MSCYRKYTEKDLRTFKSQLENELKIIEALKLNKDKFRIGNEVIYIGKWKFFCTDSMGNCYQYHLNTHQEAILDYEKRLKEKCTAEKEYYWLEDK